MIKVSLTIVKNNMEHMFGGLFFWNIVKRRKKINFQRTSGAQMESLLLEGF